MNRKKFTGLIIMMILSIIGIIWVQIVWIRNAVEVQNEGFNNCVSQSLIHAANSIENSRQMNFFNNFMPDDPFSGYDSSQDISGYQSIGGYSSPGNKLSISITNQSVSGNSDTSKVTTINKSYIITKDNSIISDSVYICFNS